MVVDVDKVVVVAVNDAVVDQRACFQCVVRQSLDHCEFVTIVAARFGVVEAR